MSKCRSCGAEIVWAMPFARADSSSSDRPFPVDALSADNGNVRLGIVNGARVGTVHGKEAAAVLRRQGIELHLSHHFTCKHGKHWKGGGGALQQTLDGAEVPLAAVNEGADDGEVRG